MYIFCGGGSGGHLYPAIALCEHLQQRIPNQSVDVLFLTTGRSIESTVLSEQAYESNVIESVTSHELKKRPVRSIIHLVRSIRRCRHLFKNRKPQAVIGLGGFGSIPGVAAARSLKIPTLLLEQNSIPGRANVSLSYIADSICTSYPDCSHELSRRIRIVDTGNPVRQSILKISRDREVPTLTILGGSQGAHAVNNIAFMAIKSMADQLRNWQILHQTGQDDNEELIDSYRNLHLTATVAKFFNEMADIYRSTSLLICRAGATTLAEVAAVGIPAILIPHPTSLRQHQLKNALYYAQGGGAVVIAQSENEEHDAQQLQQELHTLLENKTRRHQMSQAMSQLARPDATTKVYQELCSLTK